MRKINWEKNMMGILIVLLSCLFSACAGYLYARPVNEQIRNTVMVSVSALCIVFAWFHHEQENLLDYNNALHMGRFALFLTGGLALACLLPLFPFPVWPVMALAVALSFFSNAFLGLFSYSVIIMFAVFLSEASVNVFFMYFISGAVAILLFRHLDEAFKVSIPTAVSLMLFFVVETASIVLFINERLSWELFILPVMNLCLTGLLLLCVLKYFSYAIVHRYRNRYQEINDPEFELMVKLKQEAKEDYFLALHTAYFSERIAASVHADVALAKAGAYYHRFGRIYREKHGETASEEEILRRVCSENEFPPDIEAVLLECVRRDFVSKESTIVMLSDAVVSSILFLFSKEPNARPDYSQVINMIFKKKQESGILNKSTITIGDFVAMKQIFIKERLYYDFLR